MYFKKSYCNTKIMELINLINYCNNTHPKELIIWEKNQKMIVFRKKVNKLWKNLTKTLRNLRT